MIIITNCQNCGHPLNEDNICPACNTSYQTESKIETKCYYHSSKTAITYCRDCGKKICKECTTQYETLDVCLNCKVSLQGAKDLEKQIAEAPKKAMMAGLSTLFWTSPIWIIIILIILSSFIPGYIIGIISGGIIAMGLLIWYLIEEEDI